MILAAASLLAHSDPECQTVARAIRESCLEAVGAGIRTPDLGGHHGTRGYTDEVIARIRTKREVWESL
jgi:isocitrate/isopropylmalate dehydrogenase